MQIVRNVLDHFLTTKARLHGKATRVDSPDQLAIFHELPLFFEEILTRLGLRHAFTVGGSIGNGNMARVPWVGIFNKAVTDSAQEGFYIVLLFSEDMSGCFLSLNQGVTEMEKRYTRKLALAKMKEAALRAQPYLDVHPEAIYGQIDLHSTGDLGRGYDAGAVESYYYSSSALPSPGTIEEHFKILLTNYDRIIQRVGIDLQDLAPVTESEFQGAVLEKASSANPLELDWESDGGKPVPEMTSKSGKSIYLRSPSIAARALRDANFRCELDKEHWTFQSYSKNMPYVEAHHLIPMNQQHEFNFSLDVGANIVALCATCHRLLHHGVKEEKVEGLRRLLATRMPALKKRQIEITNGDLLAMYSRRVAAMQE